MFTKKFTKYFHVHTHDFPSVRSLEQFDTCPSLMEEGSIGFYTLLEEIGSGVSSKVCGITYLSYSNLFCKVYKAVHNQSGTFVAIKKMETDKRKYFEWRGAVQFSLV